MGYKVRERQRNGRVETYGKGLLGEGGAYKTKVGASKLAKYLARVHRSKTEVVKT